MAGCTKAVHLVANHGARLLPDYRFDPRSGLWSHREAPPPAEDLPKLAFGSRRGDSAFCAGGRRCGVLDGELLRYLRESAAILAARPAGDDLPAATMDERLDRLRWFELPNACLAV